MTVEELQSLIEDLAYRAGVAPVPDLIIAESNNLASTNFTSITLSLHLLNHASDDTIEGIIAHEMAHIALGHDRWLLRPYIVGPLCGLLSLTLSVFLINYTLDEHLALQIITLIVTYCLSLGSTILITSSLSRYNEYAADRVAVYLVGKNKVIKTLEFCASYRANPGSLTSTHPSDESRMSAVKSTKVI